MLVTMIGFMANAQQKQDSSYWKKGGMLTLSFSQTSLTKWSAGGDNAVSIHGHLHLFANHAKGKNSWENELNVEYGLLKQGDEGTKKSIDKIEYLSKYGYKNGGHWYYTALLDFKTQFAKGYNYGETQRLKISNFLAPAYLNLAIGMDYKPNEIFSSYISPLTAKMTFVKDNDLSEAGAFGVDPGDRFRTEIGAFSKLSFNKDVFENVNLKTSLDLFSNYAENFGNIDMTWDLALNMKINSFLTATVNTSLVYDDDIDYIDSNGLNKGPQIQFKEVVGIGLSCKF